MRTIFGRLVAPLLALLMMSGVTFAQSKVTIAVGGGACLCYLPTVLAKQLGEYDKAGLSVELVDLKGGSDALKAVLGGSADVVSGYFDHCVNLAAKKQEMQAFVVYDRYPGLVLVVSPKHTDEIKSIKDLAGKKVGVSAPGSSTDFFLKYLLKKNGLEPSSAAVIGVGLGATAVAAMEQGQIDAAVMLDPSVTVLQGHYKDLRILSDTRTQKDTLSVFGGEYPGGALYSTAAWVKSHQKEAQALTNAIVNTLKWIHAHAPEDVIAKMPPALVGKDKELYLAALKNTIPMYSETGAMEGRKRGACGVQRRFARGGESEHRREQDLYQHVCRAGPQGRCEVARGIVSHPSGEAAGPSRDAMALAVRGRAAARYRRAFRQAATHDAATLEWAHLAWA